MSGNLIRKMEKHPNKEPVVCILFRTVSHPHSEINKLPSSTASAVMKSKFPVAIELLKSCFNVGYHFCFVPYKFIPSSDGGFETVSNIFQKCGCIFVHLSVWLSGCLRIIMAKSNYSGQFNEYGAPPDIFYYAMDLMSNSFLLLSSFLIWTEKSTFEWMLSLNRDAQIVNTPKILTSKPGWRKYIPHPKIFMFLVYFALSFGKGMDFIVIVNAHSSLSEAALGFTVHTLVLFSLLFFLLMILFFLHFCNVIFFVVTVFAEFRVQMFIDDVTKDDTAGHEVLQKYSQLKKDFQRINNSFSYWILLDLMITLPFQSLEIRRLVQVEGKLLAKFMTGLYALVTCFCFSMAAKANFAMEKVREWLSVGKNLESIPPKDLILLLHELSCDNIGLQGGKFFTISYRFIASIVGLITTYTVIILQWNVKQHNS